MATDAFLVEDGLDLGVEMYGFFIQPHPIGQ
jgi:hypothetical protein